MLDHKIEGAVMRYMNFWESARMVLPFRNLKALILGHRVTRIGVERLERVVRNLEYRGVLSWHRGCVRPLRMDANWPNGYERQ